MELDKEHKCWVVLLSETIEKGQLFPVSHSSDLYFLVTRSCRDEPYFPEMVKEKTWSSYSIYKYTSPIDSFYTLLSLIISQCISIINTILIFIISAIAIILMAMLQHFS